MSSKEVLLVLLVVLMIPTAAATEDWFLTADMAKLDLNIGSKMKLESIGTGSYVNYIQTDLTFRPTGGTHQTIEKQTVTPEAEEIGDNLRFRWTNPDYGTLKFNVDTVLTTEYHLTQVKDKVAFPIPSNKISSSNKKYTQPSKYIDSNNPEIIKRAASLAEGDDDLFDVVFDIADWVMGNLRYDITVGNRVESASWILENKRGVCDEYSTLFIGLVRSLGIPAKYISGVAYSNLDIIQGFGPHAWVEVYFPDYGWIPFDFTYGELGYIDSTHVKLKESLDPGESSTKYEWEGFLVTLDTEPLDFKTEVLGHGDNVKKLLDIDIDLAKKSVGYGSYNLIEVTLTNPQDYYVPTSVQISKTTGLESEEKNRKFVLLHPGDTQKLSWLIQVKKGLDPEFMYTFPVSATTSRNRTKSAQFTSKKGEPVYSKEEILDIKKRLEEEKEKQYSRKVTLSCKSDRERIYQNRTLTVSCNISNTGNTILHNLSLCLEEDCKYSELSIGRSTTASFEQRLTELGKKDLIITAENEDITKSDSVLITVEEKPVLKIENITYPHSINSSDKFTVGFSVRKKSASTPENIKVVLSTGINKKTWPIDRMDRDRKFLINLNGKDLLHKDNKFDISVSFNGNEGDTYKISKEFNIVLNNPSMSSRVLGWSEDVLVSSDSLDWKIIVLAAVIFGIVVGIIFKNKPKKRLW